MSQWSQGDWYWVDVSLMTNPPCEEQNLIMQSTNLEIRATQALTANGARVYITGHRKEVLENAVKSHKPSDGGEIMP